MTYHIIGYVSTSVLYFVKPKSQRNFEIYQTAFNWLLNFVLVVGILITKYRKDQLKLIGPLQLILQVRITFAFFLNSGVIEIGITNEAEKKNF
jgi:hypothetical protein